MFLAGVEMLAGGRTVLQLTLMWQSSGASLWQNGQRKEFFGPLLIYTGGREP